MRFLAFLRAWLRSRNSFIFRSSRPKIWVSFVVHPTLRDESVGTTIKLCFEGTETILEIADKINEAIQKETETETIHEDIPEEENNPEKTEKSSKNFTNVLGNDDEIVEEKSETARIDYKEELSTKTVDKLKEKSAQEEASKIQEEDSIKDILDDENIPNIEDSLNINEDESFLSKEDEKNISEIIETVEKNPRITLWSAKSAAVLRYLRKTQPEFSISKEASRLIDEAIAEEYPEIWTLFNHL